MKWAGGKTQLLPLIEERLPKEIFQGKIIRYIEPFVGGGALFFFIAKKFRDIEEFILADANRELILLYKVVKNNPWKLIEELNRISKEYKPLEEPNRKKFYYGIRDEFNNEIQILNYQEFNVRWIKRAAQIIFMNRTCFNGLFRVNSKGEFNVPFGRYKNPTILDEETLLSVSHVFNSAKLIWGDFSEIEPYVDENTFVYFDPPYRPISQTASFKSYSKGDFNDEEQLRLARFFRDLDKTGAKLMLSNSDPKNIDQNDNFFDDAFDGFIIKRVEASRMINSKASKRGPINELLITNY
jgi:DNA adenine methylase